MVPGDVLDRALDGVGRSAVVLVSGDDRADRAELLAALADRAACDGWSVRSVRAPGGPAPMAAFDRRPPDSLDAVLRVVDTIVSLGDRALVLVDDAPLLDDVSAAVVHHLVAETGVHLVLASGRNERLPGDLAAAVRHLEPPTIVLKASTRRLRAGDPAPPEAMGSPLQSARDLLQANRDATVRGHSPFATALAEGAVRLARHALDGGGGTAALEVLVRSLERLGRVDEVRDLVAGADRYVVDAEDDARAASLRARIAARDGRDVRATAVLNDELVDASPDRRAALLTARLDVLVLAGRIREAVADGDELLAMGPLPPRAAAPYGLVLAQAGRARDALDQVTPILAAREGVEYDAVGVAVLARIAGLAELGRLAEASELAEVVVAIADRTDEVGFQAVVRMASAIVALTAGRIARAAELADAATQRFDSTDTFGLSGGALGVAAAAHAQNGDLAAARARLRAADSTAAQPRAFQHTVIHGRAWWLLAEGHRDRAVAELEGVAGVLRDAGSVASEILVLHDLVRIGVPAVAYRRLNELAAFVQGPLASLAAAHAAALLANDGDGLDVVAARASGIGMLLVAADAAAQAAHAHEQFGRAGRAAESSTASDAWLAACGGAFTPATAARPHR